MGQLRCRRCGALNSESAEWCGQCLGRFRHVVEAREQARATAASSSQHFTQRPPVHNTYSPLPDLPHESLAINPIRATCPHCERNLTEGAAKLWTIRGFLIFAQWGTITEMGCAACLKSRIWSNLVTTLLLGWWCIPWGIATPVVVVQNFSTLLQSRERSSLVLRAALSEHGVNTSELEFQDYASLREYRDFVDLVLGISSAIAWADGNLSQEELDRAVFVALQFGEGLIGIEEARGAILSRYQATSNPNLVDVDLKSVALRCGAFVALSHEGTSNIECFVLRQYAEWLGFPAQKADEILDETRQAGSPVEDTEEKSSVQRACEILGVEVPIGIIELRKRYRQLMWQFHPDRAEPSARVNATARSAEINWAYETLRERVA